MGLNRKEGRGSKDFKKGSQARSRGWCLKKGGLEPPYKLCQRELRLWRNLGYQIWTVDVLSSMLSKSGQQVIIFVMRPQGIP